MEYTLFSVMLCHAWSFSVMDVVGHWGCNSPSDCKFIVLHFYVFFSRGSTMRCPKKQCSHHIPKITTVDIQPDGKYIFRNNSAVGERQKSLRLILLSVYVYIYIYIYIYMYTHYICSRGQVEGREGHQPLQREGRRCTKSLRRWPWVSYHFRHRSTQRAMGAWLSNGHQG